MSVPLHNRGRQGVRWFRLVLFTALLILVLGGGGLLLVRALAAVGSRGDARTSPTSSTGLGGTTSTSARPPTTRPLGADMTSVLPPTLPAGAEAVRVPILMYHYVDEEPPLESPYADGLTVRIKDFKAQMAYLRDNGYHAVTLEQVYASLAGLAALPAKPVVITFDDGGEDNYTDAFPILQEHGFAATFFVITNTVGKDGTMTWDQLREMSQAGMVIGSHTVKHPDLTGVNDARLRSELVDSRDAIARELGMSPVVLCYPAGSYNERVMAAARAAGYRVAVTTKAGKTLDPSTPLAWPRVRVSGNEPIDEFSGSLK